MTELPGLESISDERIKNIISQFHKIIDIIQQECMKNDIAFINMGYFRKGTDIIDMSIGSYVASTPFTWYDELMFRKEFEKWVKEDEVDE